MGSLTEALGLAAGERWGKATHIDARSVNHRPKGLKSGRVPIPDSPRLRISIKCCELVKQMIVAYDTNDRKTFDELVPKYLKIHKRLDEGEIIPSLHFLWLRFPRWCPEPCWDTFGQKKPRKKSNSKRRPSLFERTVKKLWAL